MDAEEAGRAEGQTPPDILDRLTNPEHYTGAHKQRFDETGKGRGVRGRRDSVRRASAVGSCHSRPLWTAGTLHRCGGLAL